MRFKRIEIQNYRQYQNSNIVFDTKNLHVFVGIMGTGKTNLLNAISWCLYNEEQFLSREEEQTQFTRVNSALFENAKENDEIIVSVKLFVEIDKDTLATFSRYEKYNFKIIEGMLKPIVVDNYLEVCIPDDDGNDHFYKGESASSYVERFIPYGIKRYFFFNGENLDTYFKVETGQEIEKAITEISQIIFLIEVEKHLKTVISILESQAAELDSNVDEVQKKIVETEHKFEEINTLKDICSNETIAAEREIERLNGLLKERPDVGTIQKEIGELEKELKICNKDLKAKIQNKEDILFEFGNKLFLYPSLTKFCVFVDEQQKKKIFPQTNDRKLLEDILNEGWCICNRKIGSEEKKAIENIINKIDYSSEILLELAKASGAAEALIKDISKFKDVVIDATKDINDKEKQVKNIEGEIEKRNKNIEGINIEKINTWRKELSDNKQLVITNLKRLGALTEQVTNLEQEVAKYKTKLFKEMAKSNKFDIIRKEIIFAENAKAKVRKAKDLIVAKIREQVSIQTNSNFFELMWKTQTFKEVIISDNYDISIINNRNFNLIGTLSGGEREVLALSFTLALQTVSGFDAPIIIDRPLAMVSGPPRRLIAEILVKLAESKQIILLLTPDDLKDVHDILIYENSKKWNLDLTNEKILMLESD